MIEKNIVDRVPKYPGRVTLIPVDGIENAFDMARADEPQVEGTPLDKATLETIIQSRLTGRYYLPTVERVKAGTVEASVNPIPSSGWTEITATTAKNGNYEVMASGSGGTAFYPANAFDGAASTEWMSNAQTGTNELFIAIKFPEPTTITKMKMQVVSTTSQEYTISGSNNGTAWTALGTFRAAADGYLIERTLTTTGEYQWYKISCVGSQYSVREIELAEFKINTFANSYIMANGVPLVWDKGQRITIEVPTEVDTMGIVSNTLNGVTINTILQPSKKYELVYNGTSFDVKGV